MRSSLVIRHLQLQQERGWGGGIGRAWESEHGPRAAPHAMKPSQARRRRPAFGGHGELSHDALCHAGRAGEAVGVQAGGAASIHGDGEVAGSADVRLCAALPDLERAIVSPGLLFERMGDVQVRCKSCRPPERVEAEAAAAAAAAAAAGGSAVQLGSRRKTASADWGLPHHQCRVSPTLGPLQEALHRQPRTEITREGPDHGGRQLKVMMLDSRDAEVRKTCAGRPHCSR